MIIACVTVHAVKVGPSGRHVDIEFRDEPGLECGVVLAIGSRHVGWTLGEHLDALEDDVARLLDARADPGEEA